MGFSVRQITRRADGGEIVRTRVLAGPDITVGRGTDCDIQLTDLGIMLRHARISLMAGGVIAVEATGGIPLEIGGAFVTHAELDVASRPHVGLASHRLSFAPGEEPDSVTITTERVVAAGESTNAASEVEIFSLRRVLPGKRGMAWALVIGILAVFVAWPLSTMHRQAARSFHPDTLWSSGPLSTAHASLSNTCGACHHKAFVSVTDTACIACHTPAQSPAHAPADRMAASRVVATGMPAFTAAIHRRFNLPEGRCASCHKEHEGPAGALQVAANFCTDCHAELASRLSDTSLANVPDWSRHPQFKPTLVTTPSPIAPRFERVSLDARPHENSGLVYPHALHLSATNSVANMVRRQGLPAKGGGLGCGYCHALDSDRVRFKPIEMERNCGACHDLAFARDGGVTRTLPHGKPEQVAGIIHDFYRSQAVAPRAGVQWLADDRRQPGHAAERQAADLRLANIGGANARADAAIASIFAPGGVCAGCHSVVATGARNAALRYAIAPVTLNGHYLPKGRFPHGRHTSYNGRTGDAACIACHSSVVTSARASDVLLPPIAKCRECHGAARTAISAPSTCATCHGYHFGDGDSDGGDNSSGRGGDVAAPRHKYHVRGLAAQRPPDLP